MKSITVLLTGAGAPGAPSIIKCLRKNGERAIRIVGVDMNETASARKLVDVFYTVPAAKSDNFIESVLNICRKEEVQVVFPLVTRELGKFARAKEKFNEIGIEVSVMPPEVLQTVNNKANLLTKMREIGLQTPAFRIANSVKEVEDAAKDLGYPKKPICIKGAEGNGSRGVRIIDAYKSKYDLLFNEKPNSMYMSYHDIIEALKEKKTIPEMLVMEYLPGQEYGVDALCENGKVLFIGGRYNSSVNSSIPQASIIEKREEAYQIAIQLIEKLKMEGNVNFDFKYDENNVIQLIEINPRLSATITAYAPAGINFPYLRLKQLLHEKLPECTLCSGVKMQRRYTEVFFSNDDEEIEW